MNNFIYIPYFYIIKHVSSGMLYAGSRTCNSRYRIANPAELLVEGGYATSSKEVNKIILEEGLHSFKVLKIKIFLSGADAVRYETRFLTKVDAKRNPLFFNKSNNDGVFTTVGTHLSEETKEKIRTKNKGRSISSETREKLKRACSGENNGMFNRKHSAETKEKIRQKALLRLPDTEETKRKKARPGILNGMYGMGYKISGENHYFYGKKRTPEEKEKMRVNRKDNKSIEVDGIEYISISEASRQLNISRHRIKKIGKTK